MNVWLINYSPIILLLFKMHLDKKKLEIARLRTHIQKHMDKLYKGQTPEL